MGMYSTNGIDIRRDFNNNLTEVRLGPNITLYFSYETIVAFAVSGEGTFKTRKMRYSKTTARHLNSIAGHALEDEEFDARLQRLLDRINFVVSEEEVTSVCSRDHES